MRPLRQLFPILVLLPGLIAFAQKPAPPAWTVRPEWVQAHEEFLASDILAGRGSATRDEQITATYVASEFMAYGLKAAPGLSGYLQPAEIQSSELDGHGTLTAGAVALAEGTDFHLLASSGTPATGPLTVLHAAEISALAKAYQAGTPPPKRHPGAILLLADLPAGINALQASRAVRQAGEAVVILLEDDSTRASLKASGGKPRVPLTLKESTPRGYATLTVGPAAMAQLVKAAETTPTAQVTVHLLPAAAPRNTFNAIGYLPGTDPAAGTILLTAHLDHIGVGRPVDGDAIYNGANDDAAGTTAVLELAHALGASGPLRRSVLFVCYGSEEIGELGSTYFGEHPPVPLKDLVVNLEFEMIGSQDPKMPKGVLLLTGWDRSNLGPTLKQHGALLGPDPYPEQHFFERSDNYALALKGVVAHTAAGWGTPPTYHQPSDDLAHLNIPFMTAAIQSLIEPVRWLATSDFKPQWNPGGQPSAR